MVSGALKMKIKEWRDGKVFLTNMFMKAKWKIGEIWVEDKNCRFAWRIRINNVRDAKSWGTKWNPHWSLEVPRGCKMYISSQAFSIRS